MGTEIKFIHCADLHLGSRFTGVTAIDPVLGRKLTESTFASFDRLIDLAIEKNVDFMIISGDVFDEENETPFTKFRFTESIKRLKIPCFIALGNHDHKRSWEDSIPLPENAHVFSSEPEKIKLSIKGDQIEIIGISFPSRHTSNNLAASLNGSPGIFSVGVVHCSLDSDSGENYAPCRTSDLRGKNIEYWALGHIHKRSVISTDPYIVYPGNIQGRNSKESGEKGAYMVTINNSSISDIRFIPVQEIMWQDVTVNINGKDLNSIMKEITSQVRRGSILTLNMTGKGEIDSALRLHATDIRRNIEYSTECILSSIKLETSPALDLESLSKGNDLVSNIIKSTEKLNSVSRDELIDIICSTRTSSEIKWIFKEMSTDELSSLVRDAEMLLLEKLSEAGR
jgi:DNA repair exonuclease